MRRTVMFLVCAMSLLTGWGYAQVTREVVPVNPTVMSGGDLGFRVEGAPRRQGGRHTNM